MFVLASSASGRARLANTTGGGHSPLSIVVIVLVGVIRLFRL
jgi:hypothetical protein